MNLLNPNTNDQAYPIDRVPPEDLTVGRWVLLTVIKNNGVTYPAYGEIITTPEPYLDGYTNRDATHPATDVLFIDVYEHGPLSAFYDNPERPTAQIEDRVPILKGLWVRLKTDEQQDAIRVEGLLTRTRTYNGVEDVVLSREYPDAFTVKPGSLYMDPPQNPDRIVEYMAPLELFKDWYEKAFPGSSLRLTMTPVQGSGGTVHVPHDPKATAQGQAAERFAKRMEEVIRDQRKNQWTHTNGGVAVVKVGKAYKVVALADVPDTAMYNGLSVPLYDDHKGGGDNADPDARFPLDGPFPGSHPMDPLLSLIRLSSLMESMNEAKDKE